MDLETALTLVERCCCCDPRPESSKAMSAINAEIERLTRENEELLEALQAMNFMKRCNMVVDGGSMMLNVDSPFFDSLVFAEPVGSGTWLNTIKHVKAQRDECRELLRKIVQGTNTPAKDLIALAASAEWVDAAKADGGA